MEKTTGGEVVARMLQNEGVEKVFGIIDGTYIGLYAAFRKLGIELITPRHEACAMHMAGAYARLTGKLGVAIASNGPGVANVLPGVAVENGEGNRVLLITSTRRVGIGYPDRGGAYQYFNQVGVIKPMAKWSGAVPSFGRIPEMMKRAFRKSFHGRPGVVHVDIPESLFNGKDDMPALPTEPKAYRRVDPITPSADQVERAAAMLAEAKLPLIHAGSGVLYADAFGDLRRVAEALHAPVTTSWGGRGALPEQHDLAIPMPYVDLNDRVRNEADVVLALGSLVGWPGTLGFTAHWLFLRLCWLEGRGGLLLAASISFLLLTVPLWPRLRQVMREVWPSTLPSLFSARLALAMAALGALFLVVLGLTPTLFGLFWPDAPDLMPPSVLDMFSGGVVQLTTLVLTVIIFPAMGSYALQGLWESLPERIGHWGDTLGFLLELDWLHAGLDYALDRAGRVLTRTMVAVEEGLYLGWALLWVLVVALYLVGR